MVPIFVVYQCNGLNVSPDACSECELPTPTEAAYQGCQSAPAAPPPAASTSLASSAAQTAPASRRSRRLQAPSPGNIIIMAIADRTGEVQSRSGLNIFRYWIWGRNSNIFVQLEYGRAPHCLKKKTFMRIQSIYCYVVSGLGDKAEFPPDKDDAILDAEESQEPDRPVTSPVRQRHRLSTVGGGITESRWGWNRVVCTNLRFNCSLSGSEDSGSTSGSTAPTSGSLGGLHHSYETLSLNMSDCGLSQPHRPAPKPPGPGRTWTIEWCYEGLKNLSLVKHP